MRLLTLFLSVLAVALATGSTAALAAVPTVETKPAADILTTSATLTATVDPQGKATTVRFDLGTTTSYGLQSASKDAGSGTDPVTVSIPVQGLTADTTYHVRAVATNADGAVQGADVTFRTARQPTTPYVAGTTAREITLSGATLVGNVTPRGAETTYWFEYGRTSSYGTTTPKTTLPAGWTAVPVSAPVTGLEQGKSYRFRLVAQNAHGTTRSSERRLTVLGTPTAASLASSRYLVSYGQGVKLTGRLAGSKISGIKVRLQVTVFPFDAPFADFATATSSSKGNYSFTLPSLEATTRAVVIGPGMPDVLSPVITVRVAVKTGLSRLKATRTRITARGTVTPATPKGTVSLQRSTARGGWAPVARKRLRADGSYTVSVKRPRRGASYRVVGVPRDAGGHVSSASRTVYVGPRPGKRR